jgi:sec-independent protein translocase protein TatB
MFDIGFAEMLVVGVVGLLVLGPERLPTAIRTASLWLGRLRRSFNSIKSEISRELNAEELKRDLHNDAVMESLKNAEQDLRATINDTAHDIGDFSSNSGSGTGSGSTGNEKSGSPVVTPTDKPPPAPEP